MKKNVNVLLLFIASFCINILFSFSTPLKSWDETIYANLGYDLSKNPLDYSFANNGWSDYIPKGEGLYAWPNAGFRAPILPYTLSIFYFLNLDFLIGFLMPFIGALNVVLVYILGNKLFNKKIGIYSAVLFALLPLNVLYSGKIMTEALCTFFGLLSFISFWKGYEENNNAHKVLLGLFLGLAVLSRYTILWLIPIFPIYLLIKNKSLKFLKDKNLAYSIILFFAIMIPWFIYGIHFYGNIFGGFIHGLKASAYWGGVQGLGFFFKNWIEMFSAAGIVFVLSLYYAINKKEYSKKQIYFLLLALSFVLVQILMPHKEERYLMPITPTICLLSGFFIDKIKKHRRIVFAGIIIALICSLSYQFVNEYKVTHTGTSLCFLKANFFLQDIKEDSLIITDESPIAHYYTKTETRFYPLPPEISLLKEDNPNKEVYILFSDFDMPLNDEEHVQIKKELDENYKKVFECFKDSGFSVIYKA